MAKKKSNLGDKLRSSTSAEQKDTEDKLSRRLALAEKVTGGAELDQLIQKDEPKKSAPPEVEKKEPEPPKQASSESALTKRASRTSKKAAEPANPMDRVERKNISLFPEDVARLNEADIRAMRALVRCNHSQILRAGLHALSNCSDESFLEYIDIAAGR